MVSHTPTSTTKTNTHTGIRGEKEREYLNLYPGVLKKTTVKVSRPRLGTAPPYKNSTFKTPGIMEEREGERGRETRLYPSTLLMNLITHCH